MGNTRAQAEAIRIVTAFGNEGKPKDSSPADWRVGREDIALQLLERVKGVTVPHQQNSSLCGPAAFMFCLLTDRPDLYVQFVIDLWKTGKTKLGNLAVEPSYALRTNMAKAVDPKEGNLEEVDWISLGGLRGYDGVFSEPTNGTAGATHAMTMHTWFKAVGSIAIYDNTTVIGRANWNDLLKVSCHVASAWVVMLVNGSILQRMGTRGGSLFADHWIVATSAIMINNRTAPSLLPAVNNRTCINPRSDTPPDDTWIINFTAYSWGENNQKLTDAPTTSIAYFFDNYHGASVFSSIP